MEVLEGKAQGFVIHEDGTLRFHNRVRIPTVDAPKGKILDEGHNTPHSGHSGGNTMYKNLKKTF